MKRKIIKLICSILCAILLVLALKTMFVVYQISGSSMNPSLYSGDYVFVNKLTPGPRIIHNLFSSKKEERLQFKRINGYKIKRNDIIAFNKPNNQNFPDMNSFHIKRCLAISGDTFYIKNGIFKINKEINHIGDYVVQHELSKKQDSDFNAIIFNCFPFNINFNWNIKNFGPLYVPKSTDILQLDTLNIKLYQSLIVYETNKPLIVKDNLILLNDSIITNYEFKQNYYCVIGDWAFDSNDSRYWGLLPEDHIIGKVTFILFSKDLIIGSTRWDRIFKRVH